MRRWQHWSCQRCWRWCETMARESCRPAASLGAQRPWRHNLWGKTEKLHASHLRFLGSDLCYSLPCIACEFDHCCYHLELAFLGRNNAPHSYDYYYKLSLRSLVLNENRAKKCFFLPSWGFHLSMAFPLGSPRTCRVVLALGSTLLNLWIFEEMAPSCGDSTQTSSPASPWKKTQNYSFLPW